MKKKCFAPSQSNIWTLKSPLEERVNVVQPYHISVRQRLPRRAGDPDLDYQDPDLTIENENGSIFDPPEK